MPTPTWTRIVVALLAAAFIALTALTGDSIDKDGLRWLSGVAGAIVLILLAYDRWLWRWPLLRQVAERTGRPVIHGTWRGRLEYEADAAGQPGSTEIYMAVHQTYTRVIVHSYFATSTSRSLVAAVEPVDKHRHELTFAYRSEAPAPARDRNRPHQGTCVLALVGTPVEEIGGSYYTDRRGRGTISFDGHTRRCLGSLAQARRASYRPLPAGA
jgi:hypothetical protein